MVDKKYFLFSLADSLVCNYLRGPNLKTTGMAVDNVERRNLKK